MVERITSRRSTLRTLPALREEALPRPRAQRMCRGVHTESSADRSEMGQIDRSRRRRGCAGALRHKICTASLDNRPLIDGFVLALFYHRQFPSLETHGPLFTRHSLHLPRSTPHDRRGPPPMPRAELGQHSPPGRRQHAMKSYVFGFSAEVWRAWFSAQLNIEMSKYTVNPYLIEHNLININQLWRRSISALWMMVRRNRKEINELRLEATG